jgi:hypothetical protein
MYISAYASLPVPQRTHFDPDDGGSMSLRNIDIHLQRDTTQKSAILISYTLDEICTEYFNELNK